MTWIADLRHGARVLVGTPGLTVTATLTLAVAIATNTALFSIVDAAMLRPFPYSDPARIVWLDHTIPSQALEGVPVSYPTVGDWRRRSHSYSAIAAFQYAGFVLTEDDAPLRTPGLRTEAALFELLGVSPSLGRGFVPGDEHPGAPEVAVISHGLWQRRFAGRADILGQPIELDSVSHTIVGVMQPGFQFPEVAEVWVPLRIDENDAPRRDRAYRAIARLRKDRSLSDARAELSAIASELERTYPLDNAGLGVRVIPLREFYVDDERPALLLALAVGALVLMIACSNVAGLLLSQGIARGREMAMRAALGASRRRLVRQVLIESGMLAFLSVGPGLLLARYIVAQVSTLIPMRLPFWMAFEIDGRVLAFTVTACVASSLGFGAAPLMTLYRRELFSALRQAGPSGTSRRTTTTHSVLVAGEVAVALVVITVASLLLRTLLTLENVDTGFRAEKVIAVPIEAPMPKYREAFRQGSLFLDLVDRTSSLTGVEAAGVTSSPPLRRGFAMRKVTILGRPAPNAATVPVAAYRAVGPGYFRAMGIPLIAGRVVEHRDTSDSQPTVVINQSMADQFWPGRSALGQEIKLAAPEEDARRLTIVGVVGDVRQAWFGPELTAVVYVPFAQSPAPSATLMVRSGQSDAIAPVLRQIVRGIDSEIFVGEVVSMRQVVEESFWKNRLYAMIFVACALVSLALAASGVFAVVSYAVALREREWFIRAALGATGRDIVKAAALRGMAPALMGAGMGVMMALPASIAMKSLLFGVPPWDPVALGAALFLLTTIALAACVVPARRAAAADTLRSRRGA